MNVRSALMLTAVVMQLACLSSSRAFGAEAEAARTIPPDKQTVAGLYVTAAEAYQRWQADPETVKIIDVRTPEEYVFIGHPAMAWNVPLSFMAHQVNEARRSPVMKPNPSFVEQVKQIVQPGDLMLIICRSGQRSAPAVNALTEAGFEGVYNVTDGFEGDRVNDPESVFHGQRMRNGWRNAGLPWTYDLDPKLAYVRE